MLFPTQVAFGFSVWHHVFNRDGSHIFHSVLNTAKAECLTTSEVEKCRNIIGWCDEDNNPTGMATSVCLIYLHIDGNKSIRSSIQQQEIRTP